MTPDKPSISLYEQAKASLKSLFVQTAQVSIGLIIMLVATGGNPPGWLVATGFFSGVGFVAWSENKRQSELKSETQVKEDNKALFTLNKSVKAWNFLRRLGFYKFADLSDTDLSGANLFGANLSGANLSGANLFGANLSGANLSAAKRSAAKRSAAKRSDANLFAVNLSGANLSDANLSDAYLSNAYLFGANLSDANLSSANLSSANLSSANLSGVNLSGAIVNQARFNNNLGIDYELRQDLIKRGAIFVDSPEDPAWVQSPVGR
ncbi:MAG: pentapeptide repeat-containing protein [Cyanobacteria bacterium P01_G01_bin.39]